MYQTLKVGVLIFPNAEILDFAGPYEVFSVANRLQEKSASYSPFQVMTVALEKTVLARQIRQRCWKLTDRSKMHQA